MAAFNRQLTNALGIRSKSQICRLGSALILGGILFACFVSLFGLNPSDKVYALEGARLPSLSLESSVSATDALVGTLDRSGSLNLVKRSTSITVMQDIYLPFMTNCAPFASPELSPISNQGDGNYTVSWKRPPCPENDTFTFTLQESITSSFDNPIELVAPSSAQTYQVSGHLPGDYYYRVKAHNDNLNIETPWSEPQHVSVDWLMIDNFDDGHDPNLIGGENGWAGPCVITNPGGYEGADDTGYVYRLSYSVTGTCYATWQMELLQRDYSMFNTVSFDIKGSINSDKAHQPNVYLQNSPTKRSFVNIENYLPAKHVTNSWQQAVIPLDVFAQKGVDLTRLDYFQIVFEWKITSGTIYIDNIQFQ